MWELTFIDMGEQERRTATFEVKADAYQAFTLCDSILQSVEELTPRSITVNVIEYMDGSGEGIYFLCVEHKDV
jgi:hypothetical protein